VIKKYLKPTVASPNNETKCNLQKQKGSFIELQLSREYSYSIPFENREKIHGGVGVSQ
jgi:hypothetical protein